MLRFQTSTDVIRINVAATQMRYFVRSGAVFTHIEGNQNCDHMYVVRYEKVSSKCSPGLGLLFGICTRLSSYWRTVW